jgi:hypothetical protein
MLGALALDGICALMTVEGGTTRDVSLRFLTEGRTEERSI